MKNADMPAMPKDSMKIGEMHLMGLTKREMIAMHAMQGLCAACDDNGVWNHDEKVVAEVAVAYADALLEELAK